MSNIKTVTLSERRAKELPLKGRAGRNDRAMDILPQIGAEYR